jgi:CRP-like cAMP-binding protein
VEGLSENLIWMAFGVGIISACSLPLGALTSFLWRLEGRVVAAMMAFGGGALLAALTLDLVAPALDQGHHWVLFAGFLAGGLLFIGLNLLVNDFGGFRRKISTKLHHSRRETRRRLRHILIHLDESLDLQGLSGREIRELARDIEPRYYPAGSQVYREGDPADALYVVVKGAVEFRESGDRSPDPALARQLGPGEAFGAYALFTGSAHCATAVAVKPTMGWRIPESSLRRLLGESLTFRQALGDWLGQGRVAHYLSVKQGLGDASANAWLREAGSMLASEGRLPDARPVVRHAEAFRRLAPQLDRMPWFEGLTTEETDWLALHLIYRRYKPGDVLFEAGEPAERLFILEDGGITLADPGKLILPSRYEAGDGVGVRSFLTGVRHTVTARVLRDCGAWTLRREDFVHLLSHYPDIRDRLVAYLQGPVLSSYLRQRYNLDAGKTNDWTGSALRAIKAGHPPPALLATGVESTRPRGASMAIWLGILLDGIPESLVIGASMTPAGVSLSLVVGLFLANFPEALSSSQGMREEGLGRGRILLMWSSIMLLTGVGAALGKVLADLANPTFLALLEGLAAGAMLTMIAQTMLPEAYTKGGPIVGFCTLMGFFCAMFTKVL